MPELGTVGLSTAYRPADQVGGDFYDVFRAADGRIAIVMGDVSGKGVPAALVVGVIHGAVRSSGGTSAADHERESSQLNLLLCEKSSGARFASMFSCCSEPGTRVLSYVNAGHCPALIAGTRDQGIEVSRLMATGPVLGILPAANHEQAHFDVRPGDVLVLSPTAWSRPPTLPTRSPGRTGCAKCWRRRTPAARTNSATPSWRR